MDQTSISDDRNGPRRINWGILGAGRVARRFAASLSRLPDCRLTAISGRDQEKLAAFQQDFPCDTIYLDHQALLEDPRIQAIYLALPHSLHTQWAVAALAHHKAVLCEKPAVLTGAEMERIISAAQENHTLFMEAMKPRFQPAYAPILAALREGTIGTVEALKAQNCILLPEPSSPHAYYLQKNGGGCLLDSGCYGISWLQEFLADDAVVEDSTVILNGGVDWYVDARLTDGTVNAELETAFDRARDQIVTITGTKGELTAWPLHRPTDYRITTDHVEHFHIPYQGDDFTGEITHFHSLLARHRTESPVMTLKDSLACARISDAIRASFPCH